MKGLLKKSLALTIALTMMFGAAPLAGLVGIKLPENNLFGMKAVAETYSGSCGDNLTWSLDTESGELNITGSGEMNDWSSYSKAPWYNERLYIKTVTIDGGVTTIGNDAFVGFNSLTAAYYPGTPADWAKVTVKQNNTYLTNCLIFECNSERPYYLSGKCGDNVSFKLYADGSLVISGAGNMYDWSSSGPWYCKRTLIKAVSIDNGVTNIGDHAFMECDRITNVTIPDSVTRIGDNALLWCDSLTSITVDEKNQHFSNDKYGVLFNKNKSTLIQYPIGKTSTEYSIPNSVTCIGDYAFNDCDILTSVIIPDGITDTGNYTFEYCDGLTSASFPDSVTIIGYGVFKYCDNLTNVTIGKSVTRIDSGAFYGCKNLTNINIPDSVTSIGDSAFYSCRRLTSAFYSGTPADWEKVTVGSDNIDLTKCIVFECNSERPYHEGICGDNVTYKLYTDGVLVISGMGNMYDWKTTTVIPWWNNRTYIKAIVIDDGVENISDYAFEDCDTLTNVTIGNSVMSIGNSSFSGCDNLIDVKLGNCVAIIGNRAFYSCGSLKNVNMPDSVTSIGNSAFSYCDSLTNITIGNSVTSIGNSAFYSCPSLEAVYASNLEFWLKIDFEGFGSNPLQFNDNCNLYFNDQLVKNITIPNDISIIKDYVFAGCASLTSITIPESVTNIGNNAFYACTGLTSIAIPNSVTSIDDEAFSCCTKLKSIKIGNSVSKIGKDAFLFCISLTNVYYTGTKDEWNEILIDSGNDKLLNARIYFSYKISSDSSKNTIRYGDSIILHAEIDEGLPEGAYIIWTADNDNFSYSVSADGSTCTISPNKSGSTTFTATVYDKDGNIISSDTQEMTAKAGFFDKIIAFFKKIFGLTKTIPEAFKGIF